MATAAVIIIGNEILSGKFADKNGPFFIRRLREMGIDLLRIVTIPDEIPLVAAEVRAASAAFDHVFTTGGVGPTHDDITFPAIAEAFGVPLVRHPELARVLVEKMGERANEAAMRMAEVPRGADLWWDGDVVYPMVVMGNVCILPGVPELVVRKFEAVAHRFTGIPVQTSRLCTLCEEAEIADDLTEATRRWPDVAIGSYPRFEHHPHIVIVTLESRNPGSLSACDAWLRARFPIQA